jgi:hypothetical protein
MRTSPIFLRTILFAIIILSVNQAFAQSKIEISGGFGYVEFFNGRFKYGQNIQMGACIGFYPFKWYGENIVDWSCAAEVTCHFLGKSKYAEQPPWYVLGGLGYYHLPVVDHYEQYDIAFYPRIGRTLNFSKKSGMNLDIGLFLPLSKSPDYNSYEYKVLLSGGISFFIRF